MKKSHLIHICFLLPFVLTVFNLQVFATRLVSMVLAQLMAYTNLALLLLGIALTIKDRGKFSKTARLWIIFYIIYFVFAILAGALHNNPANILVSIIPFIYVLAFYVYLSVPKNRETFRNVAMIGFVLSGVLSIYLFKINFDLDRGGAYTYIDRSGGVYADANNTALAAIISFVLLFKLYKPNIIIFKIFKLIVLGIMTYGLIITFSNTGFMVFIICLIILNQKFFTGIRLIFGLSLIPILYLTLVNLNNLTANIELQGQQRDKINNIVNIVTFNTDEIDTSGRNDLLMKLINDYVFENPILGNGVNFANSQSAHNTVIGVWADAGIFALLFFLFMLGKYFIETIKSPPDIRYFVLPMLFVMCVFMLSLQSVINQPYLIALFIYMAYLIDNKEQHTVIQDI
jgi:O-antigen ligase